MTVQCSGRDLGQSVLEDNCDDEGYASVVAIVSKTMCAQTRVCATTVKHTYLARRLTVIRKAVSLRRGPFLALRVG